MSCFQLLGLPDQPTPTADEVKQAWRLAASLHHPDKGGDPTEFAKLRQAYHEALLEASQPTRCQVCSGSGKYIQAAGWTGIALLCTRCGGSGEEP